MVGIIMNIQEISKGDDIIVIEGATKRYSENVALNDVSLNIKKGETIALIGPNGAGKTTLIESMLGLKKLSQGSISIFGTEVTKNSAKKMAESIGVQLQETKMFTQWTVAEYIKLYASFYRSTADVERLIDQLSIRDVLGKPFGKLSGGYRQRLSLLLAIINDPEVVFLDEPTTGLDPISRGELWQRIKSLKSHDKTIIMSTHYMDEVKSLCDRVILIARGQIVAQGTPQSIIDNAPDDVTTLDEAYTYYANLH